MGHRGVWCQAVTCWLALDAVDEENGCLRYVRGTGAAEFRPHAFSDVMGFSQRLVDYTAADVAAEFAVRASPGDLVMHTSSAVHRAGSNKSASRHRRALGASSVHAGECLPLPSLCTRVVTPVHHAAESPHKLGGVRFPCARADALCPPGIAGAVFYGAEARIDEVRHAARQVEIHRRAAQLEGQRRGRAGTTTPT